MRPGRRRLLALAVLGAAAPLAAQSPGGLGRVTLFGSYTDTRRTDGGPSFGFGEVSGGVTLASPPADDGGFEYAFDGRGAEYSADAADSRVSLYNAWIGGRTSSGRVGVRAGQMWLDDIGGLGSVAGLLVEARPFEPTALGRFRFGLFGGLEPDFYRVGYVGGVRKYGGYVALDRDLGWKNVLGFVQVRNGSLTERSALTTLNFIPLGRDFFLYEAAEVDLSAPAGQGGSGRLTYIYANARWRASPWLEVQASYHRGLSIDTRSIAQDVLNGRPVDPRALDGFLYGSYGGRVTLEPIRGVRVWLEAVQQQSSVAGESFPRYQAGLTLVNFLRTGLDVTASDNRYERSSGRSDAFYASLGRSLGTRLYLTVDYSTSLATLSVTQSDGFVVVSHPRSKRYSASAVLNVSRPLSVYVTAEEIRDDDQRQDRGLLGLAFRF